MASYQQLWVSLTFFALAGLGWGVIDPHHVATEEERAFFNSEVLPILEENCYRCHGGEDKLKGEFRVTSREGVIRGGELGAGLNFEHPSESLLLQMVSWKNADHEMPPKKKLSDEALSVLERWVAMGAPFDPEQEIAGEAHEGEGFSITDKDREWWAYRPVERPATEATGSGAIDELLAKRLKEADMERNPKADARTLIRRAFYNLIGLSPSFEEMVSWESRFAADWDGALDALIEDLLARPQYGEKWARHWLDLVRYAETNGFERDGQKPHIWKYRDYVVGAFNEDKPYDEFVREQIAGDELDDPDFDSIVATGYHRLMQWDDEPADGLQHKYDVLDDSVRTTTETFLATTVGCARCHDHKADPISQKDYYQFMSFFHGVTNYSTQGSILRWADPDRLQALEKGKAERIDGIERELRELEVQLKTTAEATDFKMPTRGGSGKRVVKDANEDQQWWYTTKTPDPAWNGIGFKDKSWTRVYKGGFGTSGTPSAVVNNEWSSPDIWMQTKFGLNVVPDALDLWIHHDEDVEVFLNGQLIFEETGYTTEYKRYPLDQKAIEALQTGQNYLAVHCKQTTGGQYIDVALLEPTGEASVDYLALAKKNVPKFKEALQQAHGTDLAGLYVEKSNELQRVRAEVVGDPINGVMEMNSNPAPLNVHVRGSAHAKGEAVEVAFPTVMVEAEQEGKSVAIPEEWKGEKNSGRRRALAEWIASEENPLTARVMVNRLWQYHFGRGICRSTSDFGRLGEEPTHPEVIDWMAAEFMERGWSLKEMHRLLMKTETWQLSSNAEPIAMQQDPQNNLMWKYDRRRLSAEELRDSILAVSGQLNLQVGGEPAFPPIPLEVLATSSKPDSVWTGAKPGDEGRRSVYVHVKRSLREPFLASFDMADTDIGVATRFTTTVPTQALGMLNSEFVNDQASKVAARVANEPDPVAAAARLVLCREIGEEEREVLAELYASLGGDAGALNDLSLLLLNLNEFAYLD